LYELDAVFSAVMGKRFSKTRAPLVFRGMFAGDVVREAQAMVVSGRNGGLPE
jgi:hypothetical protein